MAISLLFKPNKAENDNDIIEAIDNLKKELNSMHNNFDYVTDDKLIDSYIYEIKALTMKYEYYLRLCKKNGLIAKGFNEIY